MGIALPIIAVAATVIGAGISAYGAIQQGKQQQEIANYQAQVAKNNQIVADSNATYATQAGESKAQQQELTTRNFIGSQLAAEGSSGLDVNSGSAVRLRSSAAALGTLSAMNIRSNAAREAYGFTQQGLGYAGESQLDTFKGQAEANAGTLGAFGAIIGGASKTGGLINEFQRTGAFNPNPPDLVR